MTMRQIRCDKCRTIISPESTSMVWRREQAAAQIAASFDLCNQCDFEMMALLHDHGGAQ